MFCDQGPKVSKEHNEPRLLMPGESNTSNPGILYLSACILLKHLPNGNMIFHIIKDPISKQQVDSKWNHLEAGHQVSSHCILNIMHFSKSLACV